MLAKQRYVSFFALFTSATTLICCALPAALVTFGFGAALIGLFTEVPQLIWLSQQKMWIFSFGALMLIIGGYMQWQARTLPCPADPKVADACDKARRISAKLYVAAIAIYAIGFVTAFILPKVM